MYKLSVLMFRLRYFLSYSVFLGHRCGNIGKSLVSITYLRYYRTVGMVTYVVVEQQHSSGSSSSSPDNSLRRAPDMKLEDYDKLNFFNSRSGSIFGSDSLYEPVVQGCRCGNLDKSFAPRITHSSSATATATQSAVQPCAVYDVQLSSGVKTTPCTKCSNSRSCFVLARTHYFTVSRF